MALAGAAIAMVLDWGASGLVFDGVAVEVIFVILAGFVLV